MKHRGNVSITWIISHLLVQTFCKFQLLQQFLVLVAETVVLLRTRALRNNRQTSLRHTFASAHEPCALLHSRKPVVTLLQNTTIK